MRKPTIKSLNEQLAEEKRLRRQAEDANISLQSKIAGSPTLQDKLNTANAKVSDLMKEVETLKGQKEMFENAHNKGIADYEELFDNYEKLKSDCADLQDKLNTANATVAELMAQNDKLIKSNDLHVAENLKLCKEVETLKERNINSGNLLNIEINGLQHQVNKLNSELGSVMGVLGEKLEEVETLKKELIDIDVIKQQFASADIYAKEISIENQKLKSDYALLEEKYYTQADNYTELNKMHDALLSKFNSNLDQHRAIEAENYALKAEIERTNRHINLAENQLHKEQQPTVINHYHNCTFNK